MPPSLRLALAAFASCFAVALAGAQSASATVGPYKPNDSFATAVGPLVGGQDYEGAIEAEGDVDFFYFNVPDARQFDVSVTELAGQCGDVTLLDGDGSVASSSRIWDPDVHLVETSPSAAQYGVEIAGTPSCRFRLRVSPPDAVTTSSPGVVVHVFGFDDGGDRQNVYVDGRLIGSVEGDGWHAFTVGNVPPTSQIAFEAQNSVGPWFWRFAVTNRVGRLETTLLSEWEGGGATGPPRIGLVRHVAITAGGALLESCGERIALVTCIPIDRDADGYATDRDCNDADAATHPGAVERADNAVDENCDAVRAYSTRVRLERRGHRYSGRVTSAGGGCLAQRKVVLRRVGAGVRSYARAATRAGGTFTLKRRARVRGTVFAVVTAGSHAGSTCGAATSTKLRG